ncbi:MAG: hypothetical protein FalmKO_36660 [Falsiruegeria mediterranea]
MPALRRYSQARAGQCPRKKPLDILFEQNIHLEEQRVPVDCSRACLLVPVRQKQAREEQKLPLATISAVKDDPIPPKGV